jgi:hypothetical protein
MSCFLKSNRVLVWKGSTCMPHTLAATTGTGVSVENELVIFYGSPFILLHSCDLYLMKRQIGNAGKNC